MRGLGGAAPGVLRSWPRDSVRAPGGRDDGRPDRERYITEYWP